MASKGRQKNKTNKSITRRRINEADFKYACEWLTCDEIHDTMNELNHHVDRHRRAYVASNSSYSDITTFVFYCQWRECGASIEGTLDDFSRHLFYHTFHQYLKHLGNYIQVGESLGACALGSSSKNVIPELPEKLICRWDGCDTAFDNPYMFYAHVKYHCDDLPKGNNLLTLVKCKWEGCTVTTKSSHRMRDHTRAHTQAKIVACPTCGALFSNNTKFIDHLKRQAVTKDMAFQCPHCQRRCGSERILRDHMRHHVNHYKCPICDMTCYAPSGLRDHIRYRHSAKRDFDCPHSDCEYSAKRENDLRRHMQSHQETTKSAANASLICKYPDCVHQDFTSKKELKDHYMDYHDDDDDDDTTHHPTGKNYECHLCKKMFGRGSHMTRHLSQKHNYQWPSGHKRFRYKIHPDGIRRLETIRYESIEVSEEVLGRQLPTAHSESEGGQSSGDAVIVTLDKNLTRIHFKKRSHSLLKTSPAATKLKGDLSSDSSSRLDNCSGRKTLVSTVSPTSPTLHQSIASEKISRQHRADLDLSASLHGEGQDERWDERQLVTPPMVTRGSAAAPLPPEEELHRTRALAAVKRGDYYSISSNHSNNNNSNPMTKLLNFGISESLNPGAVKQGKKKQPRRKRKSLQNDAPGGKRKRCNITEERESDAASTSSGSLDSKVDARKKSSMRKRSKSKGGAIKGASHSKRVGFDLQTSTINLPIPTMVLTRLEHLNEDSSNSSTLYTLMNNKEEDSLSMAAHALDRALQEVSQSPTRYTLETSPAAKSKSPVTKRKRRLRTRYSLRSSLEEAAMSPSLYALKTPEYELRESYSDDSPQESSISNVVQSPTRYALKSPDLEEEPPSPTRYFFKSSPLQQREEEEDFHSPTRYALKSPFDDTGAMSPTRYQLNHPSDADENENDYEQQGAHSPTLYSLAAVIKEESSFGWWPPAASSPFSTTTTTTINTPVLKNILLSPLADNQDRSSSRYALSSTLDDDRSSSQSPTKYTLASVHSLFDENAQSPTTYELQHSSALNESATSTSTLYALKTPCHDSQEGAMEPQHSSSFKAIEGANPSQSSSIDFQLKSPPTRRAKLRSFNLQSSTTDSVEFQTNPHFVMVKEEPDKPNWGALSPQFLHESSAFQLVQKRPIDLTTPVKVEKAAASPFATLSRFVHGPRTSSPLPRATDPPERATTEGVTDGFSIADEATDRLPSWTVTVEEARQLDVTFNPWKGFVPPGARIIISPSSTDLCMPPHNHQSSSTSFTSVQSSRFQSGQRDSNAAGGGRSCLFPPELQGETLATEPSDTRQKHGSSSHSTEREQREDGRTYAVGVGLEENNASGTSSGRIVHVMSIEDGQLGSSEIRIELMDPDDEERDRVPESGSKDETYNLEMLGEVALSSHAHSAPGGSDDGDGHLPS